MRCTQTLRTLASCHLTFTSPITGTKRNSQPVSDRGFETSHLSSLIHRLRRSLYPPWWGVKAASCCIPFYIRILLRMWWPGLVLRMRRMCRVAVSNTLVTYSLSALISFRTLVWCVLFGCVCRNGSFWLLSHVHHLTIKYMCTWPVWDLGACVCVCVQLIHFSLCSYRSHKSNFPNLVLLFSKCSCPSLTAALTHAWLHMLIKRSKVS